jgi:hypothetical protein
MNKEVNHDNPLIYGFIKQGRELFERVLNYLSDPVTNKDLIKKFISDVQLNYEDIYSESQFFLRKHQIDELAKLNLDSNDGVMKLIEHLLGNHYELNIYFNNQTIVYCKLFWLCVYLKSSVPFREVLKSNINNRERYLYNLFFKDDKDSHLYYNFRFSRLPNPN